MSEQIDMLATYNQPATNGTMPAAAPNENCIQLHRPAVTTKQIKLQLNESTRERWLRLSSNLLQLYGFSKGAPIERVVLDGGDGIEFRVDPRGSTRVYERRYMHRRNNPTETQLDVKSQAVIDRAFARYVERIHVTMEPGRVICRPILEGPAIIRARHRASSDPLTAFVALSAGIDAACLADAGFNVRSLLEWRPPEKRDYNGTKLRDLTETGVVSAIANHRYTHVFNEDLRQLQYEQLRRIRSSEETLGLLHISIQCDDFSAAKGKKLKAMHVEDGDTTRDLTYYSLRLVEETRPVAVMVENVPGYASSPEADQLRLVLRRMGYHLSEAILDPRAFGGFTSRRRFYLVGSQFRGFAFPESALRETNIPGRVWREVIADEIANCRDVTNNVSVQKGITTGRIRLITTESLSAPTVMKAQSHMPKDGTYIQMPDGRILFPTEKVLQRLNGIPDTHTFAAVGSEVATEQIGQSIEWPMHHAVASAVREHLLSHWDGAAA